MPIFWYVHSNIYEKKKGEGGDEKYKDLGLVDFIYIFFSLSVCWNLNFHKICLLRKYRYTSGTDTVKQFLHCQKKKKKIKQTANRIETGWHTNILQTDNIINVYIVKEYLFLFWMSSESTFFLLQFQTQIKEPKIVILWKFYFKFSYFHIFFFFLYLKCLPELSFHVK